MKITIKNNHLLKKEPMRKSNNNEGNLTIKECRAPHQSSPRTEHAGASRRPEGGWAARP